ncbi:MULTISPECIES: ABC transporter permease [unclassified Sporosarcina]|uniref:ABC transporter permease n=1 Tax=unclassified Sporosarcina TaxID=2647733 RepID=UPI00203E2D0E|nr:MULTISPECIES: ABC transporter permease [unclassified Sporosarcina]GKV63904.1 ABC transporter permease [Sporosarcina sp. NCCP-2331]GLB54684.1 ABC transporter permease [Sporosarcina sp. NCCP-2378]
MNRWIGFFKKEWTESVKTYKLLLVLCIFGFLGVLNPFTAKIMPVVMENFLPEGTVLNLPEPVALDSWLQFFKNVPQLGLTVFILLFSTMMSKELEKGTLIILLTKGLRRSTVITSKFSLALGYWTMALTLSFFITYAYTAFYWDQSGLPHLFFAVCCLYLFGILLLAVTLWGNTYFASSYGGILVTFIGLIVLFTVSIFPTDTLWNPLTLATAGPALLTGEMAPADVWLPFILSFGLAGFFLWLTVSHFKKKLL